MLSFFVVCLLVITEGKAEIFATFPTREYTDLHNNDVFHSDILNGENINFTRVDGHGNLSIYINGTLYQAVLYQDHQVFTPDCVIEDIGKDGVKNNRPCLQSTTCLYVGHLLSESYSKVKVNVCNGYVIIIERKNRTIVIQSLHHSHRPFVVGTSPHHIYIAKTSQARRPSFPHKRSASPLILEAKIVVDPETADFHGRGLFSFIQTILYMVSDLFKDSSLQSHIDVVVGKIQILDKNLPDLRMVMHDYSSILSGFCHWQSVQNPTFMAHDVAAFIIRQNWSSPEDIGLSNQFGLCDIKRNCLVAKDTGLSTALTIAHDIGHLFGMEHDEDSECGDTGNIMGAQGYSGSKGLHWSKCSSDGLQKFLQSGHSSCLHNQPAQRQPRFRKSYTKDEQCQLAHGQNSQYCNLNLGNRDPCERLSCQNPNNDLECVTEAPMTDGTDCSVNGVMKVCLKGRCVPFTGRCYTKSYWSAWEEWSVCSRLCGGGIMVRKRSCQNRQPVCAHDCVGPSEDIRLCNSQHCKQSLNILKYNWCRAHNTRPGNYICHCSPDPRGKLVAYPDGFDTHWNMCGSVKYPLEKCFRGKVHQFGCDGHINSSSVVDSCGVCNGDGRTCQKSAGRYVKVVGSSYETFHTIKAGSTGINITNKNSDYTDIRALYQSGRIVQQGSQRFCIVEPTTERISLQVMGLYRNMKADVDYQYHTSSSRSYQWTATCNGRLTRVFCINSRTEEEVEDRYCYQYPRPHVKCPIFGR